jgi:predicted metal-binding protein
MQMNKGGVSRLISLHVPDHILRKDLEIFKKKALDLGATMAEIIPANLVEIDERARLKCSIPLCPHYGKNIYCPPHGPDIETVRKALSRYNWAVLFAIDVIPPEEYSDRSKRSNGTRKWEKKCFEIVGRIETLALGEGYYLAMGFGQASCRRVLCGQELCAVLNGGNCPYPLKARPSMEGVGMDVYGLVTRVGWDIYPIYRSVNPEEARRALSVGIIFIR